MKKKTQKTVAPLAATLIAFGSLAGGALGQTALFFDGTRTAITSGGETIGYRYADILHDGSGAYVDITINSFSTSALGGYPAHTDVISPAVYPSTVLSNSGELGIFQIRPDSSIQLNPGESLDVYADLSLSFHDSTGGAMDISPYRFSILDVDHQYSDSGGIPRRVQDFAILDADAQNITWDSSFVERNGLKYMASTSGSDGSDVYRPEATLSFDFASGTSQFDIGLGSRKTNLSTDPLSLSVTRGSFFTATVPEPSSAILIGLGGLGLIARRRR